MSRYKDLSPKKQQDASLDIICELAHVLNPRHEDLHAPVASAYAIMGKPDVMCDYTKTNHTIGVIGFLQNMGYTGWRVVWEVLDEAYM